jgi:hypothetical protein
LISIRSAILHYLNKYRTIAATDAKASAQELYLRKANALYYEFEEIGLNKQLGYESPADVVDKYSQFYWNRVSPHIQAAIGYLNVTSSGRRWIAGLYSNVFRAERELRHSGPQP